MCVAYGAGRRRLGIACRPQLRFLFAAALVAPLAGCDGLTEPDGDEGDDADATTWVWSHVNGRRLPPISDPANANAEVTVGTFSTTVSATVVQGGTLVTGNVPTTCGIIAKAAQLDLRRRAGLFDGTFWHRVACTVLSSNPGELAGSPLSHVEGTYAWSDQHRAYRFSHAPATGGFVRVSFAGGAFASGRLNIPVTYEVTHRGVTHTAIATITFEPGEAGATP